MLRRDEARGAQGAGHGRRPRDRAAIAGRLAAEGADVVIGDIDDQSRGRGRGRDQRHRDRPRRHRAGFGERGGRRHGPFAILVNNAGTDEFGFFTDTDRGNGACPRRQSPASSPVPTPSSRDATGGLRTDRQHRLGGRSGRLQGSAVYSAAKGGVIAFTKVIAREARVAASPPARSRRPDRDPAADRGARSGSWARRSSTR